MIYTLLKSLFYTIPLVHTFGDLVGSIVKVCGRSMQPTLNPNSIEQDYIVLNKWDRFNVSRGDIVVIISPQNPGMRIVKRVIALEGDIIPRNGYKDIVQIPTGYVWVEGDHLEQSMDSNAFGAIPLGLIAAKVMCIIWPIERIQSFNNKNPVMNKL